MKASGRYDERIDAQLSEFYSGRFGSPKHGSAAFKGSSDPNASFNVSNASSMLTDDVDVDDVLPLSRAARSSDGAGTVLRIGHRLPTLPPPPKSERVFDSKYIFRDISGPSRKNGRSLNPLVSAGWDGVTRPATNRETLYRSWETRYWRAERASPNSADTLPYDDADADKPRLKAGFRVPP